MDTTIDSAHTLKARKEVGGWLLFFCIQLTILSPVLSFGKLIESWKSVPGISLLPLIRNVMVFESVCSVMIVAYGAVAGIIIWSGSATGYKIAKQYLIIRLCGYAGMELIAFLMMENLPADVLASAASPAIIAVLQQVILFLLWWFYFKKSKRVKETYELRPVSQEVKNPALVTPPIIGHFTPPSPPPPTARPHPVKQLSPFDKIKDFIGKFILAVLLVFVGFVIIATVIALTVK